jgi:hypothetical protein
MSSETSTSVRTHADVAGDRGEARPEADPGLQPWQFFVLAALGCATAVTFVARGQGVTSILLLSVLMGTAAFVGMAALRTLRPLVSREDDRVPVVGSRTRAGLEREKTLALRAIKDLEFDRAMGKLSEEDWKEMSSRLRTRAARLMRQLDAGSGYRQQIERDLEKRLDAAALKGPRSDSDDRGTHARDGGRAALSGAPTGERLCASCSTGNDADAKFCKNCGTRL